MKIHILRAAELLCTMCTGHRPSSRLADERITVPGNNNYSAFTYYGSLEIEKLIKIVFQAQIGGSQGLEAGYCDFDSFRFAYSHGKLFARP